ncbi:roadblock/LC7 domain-containing protein [bacterium]|nr:roadblock/LC7 domain-containing protein [bacterium]
MADRKSSKKPEKKGFLGGLFAGFGAKKDQGGKKKPVAGGKKGGTPVSKKGASLAKKPKVQAPPPEDDAADLLGSLDDDLFAGMDFGTPTPPPAPAQAERRVPPVPPQPVAQAPEPTPAPAQGNSLFGPDGVDDALDSLFDSFEVGGAPAAPVPQAPVPQAAPPQPVASPMAPPPFAEPSPPPFAEPVPAPAFAQPAPPAPAPQAPAAQQPPQQDGLVSIGKLLVDQNTLKRIIDNAEKRGTGLYTTTKIISNAKGADLDSILGQIDACQGVAGSLIVGRDGLVISSTLPQNFDKELIGAISSSMLTNLDVQCKKMKLGASRQVILDTEGGVVLLISLEVGVLVVMSQSLMGLDLTGVLSVIAGVADKI